MLLKRPLEDFVYKSILALCLCAGHGQGVVAAAWASRAVGADAVTVAAFIGVAAALNVKHISRMTH